MDRIDISLQTIQSGFQNMVVYDIELKHFSKGRFDKQYLLALFKVYDKWESKLPVFLNTFTNNEIKKIQSNAEKSLLTRLIKRMVRAGMTNLEIVPIINKYSTKKRNNIIQNITITLIRISSKLRNKMLTV
jgi:hypothetical protein